MTPLLVLFFGFKPSIAIGTDIVHGAIFKSFGAVQHRRLGHVMRGSPPGCSSAPRRSRSSGSRSRGGSGASTATGTRTRRRRSWAWLSSPAESPFSSRRTSSPEDKPFLLTNRDRAIALATGVVGGFVVGLTSVGSGTLFGLVMLIAFPLTAAKIVGTDIFHAAILLGRRRRASRRRSRRPRGDRLAPDRLRARRPDRRQVHRQAADRALRIALAATLTLAGVRLVTAGRRGFVAGAALAAIGALLAARWLAGRGSVVATESPEG